MAIAPIADAGDEAAVQAALAAGDRARAFELLASVFAPAVGRFCMAMLDQQADAQAAAEATLSSCHGQLISMTGRRLRPWLFGLALSECQRRMQLGSTRRQDTVAFSLESTHREAASTRGLLARIPRDQREAALLRYIGRLGYADIGVLCGMSAEKAQQQVGRSLLNLRQEQQQGAPDAPDARPPRVRARA